MTITFTLDTVDNNDHRVIRAGLNRASWLSAKGLSKEQRTVLYNVCSGTPVPVEDIVSVIVAGLSANATRFGQSMARRAGRAPLLALYNALPATGTGPRVDAASVEDIYAARSSRVEQEHRERVEQAQAAEITRLKAALQHQRDNLTDALRDIAHLEQIATEQRQRADHLEAVLAQGSRSLDADRAAHGFALDIMTGEQRARVSDFRTGFRAAQA